jgi:hypothetical protein
VRWGEALKTATSRARALFKMLGAPGPQRKLAS